MGFAARTVVSASSVMPPRCLGDEHGCPEKFFFHGDPWRWRSAHWSQYGRFWFARSADICIEIKAQEQHCLNKAGVKIMCVSRIWRLLYNIPGTVLSELDEGGPGGFQ